MDTKFYYFKDYSYGWLPKFTYSVTIPSKTKIFGAMWWKFAGYVTFGKKVL